MIKNDFVFSCLPSDDQSATESQSTNLNPEWKASLCYEESDVGMMSTAEKAYSWTMIVFAIVVLIIGELKMSLSIFLKNFVPGQKSPESLECNGKNLFSKFEAFTIENRLRKCLSPWMYIWTNFF